MRRIVLVLLVVALLLSLSVSVAATEVDDIVVSPRYTHILSNTVGLSIDESTGKASCSAYCVTRDMYTVEVECKLQIYTNYTWYNLRTWTASGTRFAAVDKTWIVSSGYTYRVHAIFRVYDAQGNLLEEVTSNDGYVYPKQ